MKSIQLERYQHAVKVSFLLLIVIFAMQFQDASSQIRVGSHQYVLETQPCSGGMLLKIPGSKYSVPAVAYIGLGTRDGYLDATVQSMFGCQLPGAHLCPDEMAVRAGLDMVKLCWSEAALEEFRYLEAEAAWIENNPDADCTMLVDSFYGTAAHYKEFFNSACQRHDACYSLNRKSRKECDDQLHRDSLALCWQYRSLNVDASVLDACTKSANSIRQFVGVFGGFFYWKSWAELPESRVLIASHARQARMLGPIISALIASAPTVARLAPAARQQVFSTLWFASFIFTGQRSSLTRAFPVRSE